MTKEKNVLISVSILQYIEQWILPKDYQTLLITLSSVKIRKTMFYTILTCLIIALDKDAIL